MRAFNYYFFYLFIVCMSVLVYSNMNKNIIINLFGFILKTSNKSTSAVLLYYAYIVYVFNVFICFYFYYFNVVFKMSESSGMCWYYNSAYFFFS